MLNAIVDAIFDFASRHRCTHLFTLEGFAEKVWWGGFVALRAGGERGLVFTDAKSASKSFDPSGEV